jgi:hypothetical protein
VSLNHTLPISLCYSTYKSLNHPLNLDKLTSCPLLQLRTSRGCLLPRTDSSLNRTNSVTYIAEGRTRITGNSCHMTTTHRCMTSPRTRKKQTPLLLRVGPCLQICYLTASWSNPLHYLHRPTATGEVRHREAIVIVLVTTITTATADTTTTTTTTTTTNTTTTTTAIGSLGDWILSSSKLNHFLQRPWRLTTISYVSKKPHPSVKSSMKM